jgi:hypothetical protein
MTSRGDRAEDRDVLERFLKRARYVDESELVQRAIGATLQMHWERGSPVVWTSKEPSGPAPESLLVRLRPVIAHGSEIFINRVHNICQQRLDNAEMRAFLVEVRSEWAKSQRRGLVSLKVDEQEIRPDHLADLMINGYYFHDEPAKRAELEQLVGPVALIARHVFLDYVYGAIEATYSTADVVRIGLERDMFG